MRCPRGCSGLGVLIWVLLVAVPGAVAQPAAPDLRLPVPRTFDLTHVEPTHYAAALGKDPVKIFEFVRDQIGFEIYMGALRGPRGTLLAMAGNSVDRAALLAGLLQQSGQKVRFARGTLPEARARELVTSLWKERPPRMAGPANSTPSPSIKMTWDTLMASVKRDHALIRDHLKKANVAAPRETAPSLEALVKEAQPHYWVQWWKDGVWKDLDPSFGDASPGRKYASVEATFDALPEALFHYVEIRLRLEEYTGDKPASRVILTHRARAADWSGKDVVLTHQPENWKGPAASIAGALASAVGNTGRLKPVLVVGERDWIVGKEPFRPKPPTGAGIGSIGDMLGGAGTRNPVPIATAETIEFDFIFPGGRKETVTREIYDLVGKARRMAGRNLSAEEVKTRTESADAPQLSKAMFDLFFTTGAIEAGHVPTVVPSEAGQPGEGADVRAILRRMNVAFTVVSDGFLRRVGRPETAVVAFYPDSPRLQIMEISKLANRTRFSLDLRRQDERSVVTAAHPDAVVTARILKGVFQGALERAVVESAIGDRGRGKGLRASVSTSALFERAIAEQVPMLLLPRDVGQLQQASPDALARLRGETAVGGVLALAPQRPVNVGGLPRLAWWRIDSRTGDTVAVTDDGLHQEYVLVNREGSVVTVMDANQLVTETDFVFEQFAADFVSSLLQAGARYSTLPFRVPGVM